MTQLFAAVYLDEDVSVVVADMLRARGFRAVTTLEAGRLGVADTDQLSHASSHQMTLLTHNRTHFEVLHQQHLTQGQTHWGIIIAGRRRPPLIMANLLRLLNRLTADEIKNQQLYM